VKPPPLKWIFLLALLTRTAAADAIELALQFRPNHHSIDLFPDTDIYWRLAQTIRSATLYQIVEWNDLPRFALRTPGYPLFLAFCQLIGGPSPLAARLIQALLAACCVGLINQLARQFLQDLPPLKTRTFALYAALLYALHPYTIASSVILLSESLFTPLLLAFATGLATLSRNHHSILTQSTLALATGLAAGLAILTRPSFALFTPIAISFLLIHARFHPRTLLTATLLSTSILLVMTPWWLRNQQIYGRFVPTALWLGASLYDGLNPSANGGSNMSFLADQDVWPLDEEDQDRFLIHRSLAFVRTYPLRTLELAANKWVRYWTPWPRADGVIGWGLAGLGCVIELPILLLALWELARRRRDLRAWVILAGPLLYFCVVHLAFASSMRYRLPAEPPALVLAVGAVARLTRKEPGQAIS